MRKLSVIALATLLGGCQAMVMGTAADFNKVSLGMTKAQVINEIGKPNTVSADANAGEEHLIYRRMPQTFGWLPKNYYVTLKDGKVVKYGEYPK